ncbi:MAG TPA: ABC transporter ATP-binding protein [Thermoanaerobaculales bacterium]|nr:ABC transporter ATP-binding protein [Thermoanaerobaculales bacterium]HQL31144.1 ABC transporter ATP-binding protein [Thermoanaerobaculales bacterium]
MAEPLLTASGLCRTYPARSAGSGRLVALDGVDLWLERGGSLGVVGESGAGKSTLARLLLALERPDAGVVTFDGREISAMRAARVRPLRRRFQAVFQDPLASLNPRLAVGTSIAEPLVAFAIGDAAQRRRRVTELLAAVGLPEDAARRRPGAFSGGERQRVAIARALASDPELLVLDEPVSALDAGVRGQVLALIGRLRAGRRLALVLIAHDLAVVRRLCDRVAVLYRGVVVEEGPVTEVLARPAHPYTAMLRAAAPAPDPAWRPPPTPAPANSSWPATACRFAPRCPHAAGACAREPELEGLGPDRRVRCWFPHPTTEGSGVGE